MRSSTPFLSIALRVLLSTISGPSAAIAAEAATRPNIIVITTDDQGYSDLTIQGSREIPTPYIDSIGLRGVQATNGYVTAPLCGPSRAAFITGRYQQRFSANGNPGEKGPPRDEKRLPEELKAVGYKTGVFGKWHLGHGPEFLPNVTGYDYFFGTPGWGHYFLIPSAEEIAAGGDIWMRSFNDGRRSETTNSPVRGVLSSGVHNLWRNTTRVTVTDYLTDVISDEAVKFIDENKASPFFIHVSYNAPHTPLQATQYYLDRFPHLSDTEGRRTYAAMVAAIDDGVGRILAKLKEHQIDENTLVVFFSDNGGAAFSDEPEALAEFLVRGSREEAQLTERLGESPLRWGRHLETRIGGNGSDNGPLRFGKGTLYEGGVRVPYLVSWPARIPKGQRYEGTVSTLDIYPTALAAAGVTREAEAKPLDGEDLLPYLAEGKAATPRTLYWRYSSQKAIRSGDWKLIESPGGKKLLYNLKEDVGERQDLAAANPAIVEQLSKKWDEWNATLPPPPAPPGTPAETDRRASGAGQ